MSSARKRKKQAPQSSSFFSVGENKQQKNPSQESKTPAVVASKSPEFHYYSILPADLKSIVLGFLNYNKELPLASIAHGRSYLRNSDIYPRILQQLASNKKYTALSRDTLAAVPSAGPLNRLFSSRLSLAGKLLNAVVDADYCQALMIAVDPSLMFEPVNFIYRDGNSERISPLKYAFKVYDTYMWKLFYENIKNNPDYVKQFLRQAQEQTTHITLEPLFEAYKEYEKQLQRCHRGDITSQALDEEWYKLGKVQKAKLPVHMLKEFSREKYTWDESSAFDVHVTPALWDDCQLLDLRTRRLENLSSILLDSKWGVTFSLSWIGRGIPPRVQCPGGAVVLTPRCAAILPHLDRLGFHRLFEQRIADLTKGISQDFQEPLKQQNQNQYLYSSSASRVTP